MGVSKASYWHGSFIDVWQQTSCVDRRLAKDKAGGSTGGGWLPVDFFFLPRIRYSISVMILKIC